MNIETAIKTLEDHLKVVGDVAGSSYPIAMKLGIEALKRCQYLAEHTDRWSGVLLLGETK